jgi:Zn-dependent protease with chaperone function
MFFRLSSFELGLILFGIVLGSTLLGSFVGHRLRGHADTLREPFGVVQAALLGLVALILAFGLTMAVGRYDSRRAAVVADANAIGTTYLRAQTLREPMRV